MKAAGDERENATAPVTAVDVAGGSGGDAELLSLLHRAGTGVAFLNAEGRVAHANHVFAHMVGVGDAALRSLTIERLVAPHDRAEVMADLAAARGGPIQRDWRLLRRGGGFTLAAMTATVVPGARGEMDGTLLTAVALTDPLQSQERLRAALAESESLRAQVLAAVPDSVLVVGPDGRIIDANTAACLAFGYTPEEFVNLSIDDLVPGRHRAAHAAHRARFFDAPRPRLMGSGMQLRATRKNGTEFPVDITLGNVSIGDDALAIAIVRDITEQLAMASALREQQSRLQIASVMETLGRLSAGLAHDFTNIMQVVEWNARSAAETITCDTRALPHLADIQSAAARAAELTRDLMDVGRRGVTHAGDSVSDVTSVIASNERMFRRLLGADITLKLSLTRVPSVRARESELEQVLFNLLSNANDAIDESGTVLIETSSRCDAPGSAEWVVLTISDTGSGMTSETVARLSEPFFTTKPDGTGIGLTSVFEIVKGWGGRLEIESRLGHGSTFRVVVPTVSTMSGLATPPEAVARHSPRTVVVVDDDPLMRKFIGTMLSRAGYAVLECDNGQQAVSWLETREPVHAVVADVVMPKMDGFELVRALHERDPRLPVLLISGHPREKFVADGTDDRATPFLQKPFRADDIVSRLRLLAATA